MKLNVFFKNNHGSHWVLSDGSPLFESPLFETRASAIKDLEQFVTLMESPSFIDADKTVNLEETENSPLAFVIFKQNNSRWYWELFISINAQSSKVAENSDKGFESFELARQNAKFFCNSIVDAPILDQNEVAISGVIFSKSFEHAHNIEDIHPSSKWYK